jgi:hypothetical protein
LINAKADAAILLLYNFFYPLILNFTAPSTLGNFKKTKALAAHFQ